MKRCAWKYAHPKNVLKNSQIYDCCDYGIVVVEATATDELLRNLASK